MLGWSPWKACSFLHEQWIWRWVGGVRRRRGNFSRDVLYERIINKKVKRKYLIFTALRSCKEHFIISNLSLTEEGDKRKKAEATFLFFHIFIYNMYECFVCMQVHVSHACSSHKSQKRTSEPLKLDEQLVERNHVHAGNGTQVLWKSSNAFNSWATSSAWLSSHFWRKFLDFLNLRGKWCHLLKNR